MKRSLALIATLPISMSFVAICMQSASRVEPQFYCDALEATPIDGNAAKVFERLDLKIETNEQWATNLTDDHINAWLAKELIKKFPGVLPKQAREPRIKIQRDSIRLACQLKTKNTRSIFSVVLRLHLTDQENEILVTLENARVGLLPVPIGPYRRHISRAAERSQIPLHWTKDGGRCSFVIRLPDDRKDLRPGIVINSLELADGSLRLQGRSTLVTASKQLSKNDLSVLPSHPAL